MSTRVEVLLCTYNGSAHLHEQLDSILRQTRPVDRLTIHDDASTDATVALLRDWIAGLDAAWRARVWLHAHAVNRGYAGNFGQAVAGAEGDVLLLCDQDDVWEPDKVAALLAALGPGGPDLVFSDGLAVDAAGRPLPRPGVLAAHGLTPRARRRFADEAFAQLLRRNVVNGAACALRRTAAQAALPVPAGLPHDHWFALWCAAHGGVALLPRALYRYRQHAHNVIGLGSQGLVERMLGIWRHPRAPRERERLVCRALVERLAGDVAAAPFRAQAQAKLQWLDARLARERPARRRLPALLHDVLAGRYRRWSPPDAPWRDLVAWLRRA